MDKQWMSLISILIAACLSVGCGDGPTKQDGDGEDSNDVEETGCMEQGPDGNRIQVCTLQSPIQETGFLCPQGTPYLHEYESAAVCAENPNLSEEQRRRLRDEGLESCDDNPGSDFCQPAEPSDERQSDCDEIIGSFDCLDQATRDELQQACEDAAVAAAPEDWADLNSCMLIANNGTGADGSLCPDKSGCVGRVLRVCHEYNDECWDIREGRAGTCDNLEGELEVCVPDAERQQLVDACEAAVTDYTDAEFQELEDCFTTNLNSAPNNPEHPYCENVRTCSTDVLLSSDTETCADDELSLTLINETDDPDLDTSGLWCVAENTADNCPGTTFEERCTCYEERVQTELPDFYQTECEGGFGFRCEEENGEIVSLKCAIMG